MSSILTKNIGTLVTGNLESPLREADSIFIKDGLVQAIGNGLNPAADQVIDAHGITAIPGLIDSHSHPSIGEYTLAQRKVHSEFPEAVDARLGAFSANSQSAARTARDGKLSGLIFVGEIWRWDGEPQKLVRVLAEFKLIRIADGAILWETRVQRAVPTTSATNLGQAYTDAVKAVMHEIFG